MTAIAAPEPPSRTAPVVREADVALVRRYQRHDDRRALDELLRRHLPLAHGLAGRYKQTSESFDDLRQVAAAGLVLAIRRFDPTRGGSLAAYAAPTILGELRRYFRDTTWSVHVSRGLQERAQQVRETVDLLGGREGRSPSVAQVAEAIGATREQVIEALEVRKSYRAASLDVPDDDDVRAWHESFGGIDHGFDHADARATLDRALEALPARERAIVEMRFRRELSQSEIGAQLGISQMHVSRLLRRALDRMGVVLGA